MIPLLIHSLSKTELESYRQRIRTELPDYRIDDPNYEIIYKVHDDKPGDYTRAIQELEILKTRIKYRDWQTGRTRSLRSFVEVWEDSSSGLANAIRDSDDPNEAKWQLAKKFHYKIATTFMPMYAKSIYEYFGARCVLDPCIGWGDRMAGALSSTCVQRYVGFDPNIQLIAGYTTIQQDFGHRIVREDKTARHIEFKSESEHSYEIHSVPFETASERLHGEQFDFAFTSPPFFDYEEYNPNNPTYQNWYKEFYEPLFLLTEKHLKPNAFFAVHLDDTSAGKIRDFLFQRVGQITTFQYCGKIGLVGGKSGKIRNVFLFQKQAETNTSDIFSEK